MSPPRNAASQAHHREATRHALSLARLGVAHRLALAAALVVLIWLAIWPLVR